MQKLTHEHVKIIEVQDQTGIAILTAHDVYDAGDIRNAMIQTRWHFWRAFLQARLGFRLQQGFIDQLVEDIYDWEKNGNLYDHSTDEVVDINELGRWRLGKEWNYEGTVEIVA